MNILDSKIPLGDIREKWNSYKAGQQLVNPANKRKLDIIVIGTGLAGASAAASLGEMGFNVKVFCIQDSLGVPIVLRHRAVSMRQRTIPMTATVSGDCFMIL